MKKLLEAVNQDLYRLDRFLSYNSSYCYQLSLMEIKLLSGQWEAGLGDGVGTVEGSVNSISESDLAT